VVASLLASSRRGKPPPATVAAAQSSSVRSVANLSPIPGSQPLVILVGSLLVCVCGGNSPFPTTLVGVCFVVGWGVGCQKQDLIQHTGKKPTSAFPADLISISCHGIFYIQYIFIYILYICEMHLLLSLQLLLLAASGHVAATKRLMTWVCLEFCGDSPEMIADYMTQLELVKIT
jgi:hypothetical protein